MWNNFLSLLKMSMPSIFNGPASLQRQPTLIRVPEVWLYSKNKEFSDTYFKRCCNLLDDFPQMNINIVLSFTEITEKQFDLIGNNIEQSPIFLLRFLLFTSYALTMFSAASQGRGYAMMAYPLPCCHLAHQLCSNDQRAN